MASQYRSFRRENPATDPDPTLAHRASAPASAPRSALTGRVAPLPHLSGMTRKAPTAAGDPAPLDPTRRDRRRYTDHVDRRRDGRVPRAHSAHARRVALEPLWRTGLRQDRRQPRALLPHRREGLAHCPAAGLLMPRPRKQPGELGKVNVKSSVHSTIKPLLWAVKITPLTPIRIYNFLHEVARRKSNTEALMARSVLAGMFDHAILHGVVAP